MLVSIIIVTYQSASTIGRCLDSIAAHGGAPVQVVVVDNASTDSTIDAARHSTLETEIIPLDRNYGFARAANVGAERAHGDTLLFLNPDAELTADTLLPLSEALASNATCAAAGPRLVYPDGAVQDAAFTYPSLLMTWLEFFPRPGRVLHSRLNGRLSSPDGRPIEVDHPLGACMLVRHDAWLEVGPFDEHFFLYCEEVDWCMRARRQGWSILHVPAAVAIHVGGASAAMAPGASLVHLYASRRYLHRKHRSFLFRRLAMAITWYGLERTRRRLAAQPDLHDPQVTARLAALRRAIEVTRA